MYDILDVMKSRETGPRPESEQTAESQPEEEGSTLKSQESVGERILDPEKATAEEKSRLGGILQTLGTKTKAQVAAVLFMAMTSGALAGFHHEATAAGKKEGVRTEQVEREKGMSVFAPYFRDVHEVIADKKAMRQLRESYERAVKESQERKSPFETEVQPLEEEAKAKLADSRKLSWLSENDKGEQEVTMRRLIFFRPEVFSKPDVKNVKKTIFHFYATPKGAGKIGFVITHSFQPGDDKESFSFEKPQYKDNPTFYADAVRLLKSEYAVRTTPDGKTTEFVRPVDAEAIGTRIGLQGEQLYDRYNRMVRPNLVAAELAKEADTRLALLRLQEVGEALGFEKIIQVVQNALNTPERSKFKTFFKE